MKKIFLYTASALMILSCDKVTNPRVGAPYSEKLVGSNFVTNKNKNVLQKKVLVEDYTGHTCGNCPKAAVSADSIQQVYGDQVVVMAVHAGNFAAPDVKGGYPLYYGTPAGEVWFQNPSTGFGFFSAGNPNGMINRKAYPGNTGVIEANSKWFSTVNYAINNDPSIVRMNVTSFYDSTIRTLNLDVSAKYNGDGIYENNLVIMAATIEDSIVGPQKQYFHNPERIQYYRFDHMLRSTFNNQPWGLTLKKAPINVGDTAHMRFVNMKIDPSYNDHNMWAIVYIYDALTLEVIQVDKVRIQQQSL